jgi:hypothetical protein
MKSFNDKLNKLNMTCPQKSQIIPSLPSSFSNNYCIHCRRNNLTPHIFPSDFHKIPYLPILPPNLPDFHQVPQLPRTCHVCNTSFIS